MGAEIFWRNDIGYEQARRSAVSNGRKPDRFPDVIVRVQSDSDVTAAVRLAKQRGLKIGTRSGDTAGRLHFCATAAYYWTCRK